MSTVYYHSSHKTTLITTLKVHHNETNNQKNIFILCNFKSFSFAKYKQSSLTAHDHSGSMTISANQLSRLKDNIEQIFGIGFSRDILEIFFFLEAIFQTPVSMLRKNSFLPVSTQSIVALNRPTNFTPGVCSPFHVFKYFFCIKICVVYFDFLSQAEMIKYSSWSERTVEI